MFKIVAIYLLQIFKPLQQHFISARKFDQMRDGEIRPRGERISLTFRRGVSQSEAARLLERHLVKDRIFKMEKKISWFSSHVFFEILFKDTYDHIAENFSNSRYKMWPLVEKFVSEIHPDAILADLGCGNGKNLLQRGNTAIGLDVSINLATICRGLFKSFFLNYRNM